MELKDLLNELALDVKKSMKDKLKQKKFNNSTPFNTVATGKLYRSINPKVDEDGELDLLNGLEKYWENVEKGRKPSPYRYGRKKGQKKRKGRSKPTPFIKALMNWIKVRRITFNGKPANAYAMANKINRDGIKPLPFVMKTYDETVDNLNNNKKLDDKLQEWVTTYFE